MKTKPYPTQEQIKRLLDYDPETGVFTWKKRTPGMFTGKRKIHTCNVFNSKYSGCVAGRPDTKGYILITVKPVNTRCLAHRLAWIYVYGYVPEEIDHINGNKSDNSISNLREVSHRNNQKNFSIRKDSKSGVNGVSFSKKYGVWRPRIKVNYKAVSLGFFDDFTEAVKARYEAEKKYGFTKMNPESSAYQYLQEQS